MNSPRWTLIDESGIESFSLRYWISEKVQELLKNAYQFLLPLDDRYFYIENWNLYVKTWHSSRGKIIEANISKKDVNNNLLRDLTARLSSLNDWFTTESTEIKEFMWILLRVAWDKLCRSALRDIVDKYGVVLTKRIDGKTLQKEKKWERKAIPLAKDYMEKLNLTEEEIDIINKFSWENKETHMWAPNYNFCWVVTACILNMIDLEKE